MAPAERDRLGRFELISLLGEGGMAQVYLALLRGPGGFKKLSVIKKIRPELAYNRDFITMFRHEARLAARLSHPNVVQTYQIVEENGNYGLAMEFLDGQSLSEIFRRLGRRGLSLDEHLWILSQVLFGLEYAHTLQDYDGRPLGIVHRDVNPANVFVTYEGDIKLLDFGIAKVQDGSVETKRGTVKGKLGYCAPEQVRSLPVDGRADIFAVGVMLWEALAGKRMARGATAAEICEARISGLEPKIRQVHADVPSVLAAMCDRATALNRDARYATSAEFLADIEAFVDTSAMRAARAQVAARLQLNFDRERQLLRKRVEAQISASFDAVTQSGAPSPREPTTKVESGPSQGQTRRRRRSALVAAAVAVSLLTAGLVYRMVRARPPVAVALVARAAEVPGEPRPRPADPPSPLPSPPSSQPAVVTKPVEADLPLVAPDLAARTGSSGRGPYLGHLQGWWRGSDTEEVPADRPVSIDAQSRKRAEKPAVRRDLHSVAARKPPARARKVASSGARSTASPVTPPQAQQDDSTEPGTVLKRTGEKRPRQRIDEEDPYHP